MKLTTSSNHSLKDKGSGWCERRIANLKPAGRGYKSRRVVVFSVRFLHLGSVIKQVSYMVTTLIIALDKKWMPSLMCTESERKKPQNTFHWVDYSSNVVFQMKYWRATHSQKAIHHKHKIGLPLGNKCPTPNITLGNSLSNSSILGECTSMNVVAILMNNPFSGICVSEKTLGE